ncbi:class I fructose-bisphosphate aldolase [Prosthecomicrobium pneumaticum]|uniref:Probable fructose-bisphosphate aldolase class 1 n=1 Tax=Prosthecomicrobium pneumaticum TaxID=81895 RepID=A0A7W9CW00_9HYPH|nr:class I fructose-bisphosphate aldolase [Prosthecomicrobium pneumaticum]MBB5752628.1 fructose-bisphosphate aldolase class I [Prosthecomicrobium pneumaticum]
MTETLQDIARRMVARGKGILAADESSGTIKKRFDTIGLASTADSRRDYREMLFRADTAMREHISGVILYDETIRQSARDGTPLVEIIKAAGSIPGIKVDAGAKPLAGYPGETITEGLDGLRERLAEYYALGARFAKWRGVIAIGEGKPTDYAIVANADALARYAALCQEAGIVPIVEPEVLMDGEEATHDIDRCAAVTRTTLHAVFAALDAARVDLTGIILKPNMVIAGKDCPNQASAAEVAEKTLVVLKQTVPTAVPGIAFLSGGQSDEAATEHLSLMNAAGPLPWALTFSYGRALQAAAIKAWGGKPENVAAGQRAFLHRARMNGLAAGGAWTPELEREAA